MKKKEILKTIITIIVSVVLSSGISVYATSTYLYDSCDVSYDNTSSGLNATNVQSSLDELYMHATDYSELKNYFQNNPTSYFNQNDLRIGANDTSNHESYINFYSSNVNRGAIGISNAGDMQLVSKNASGVNGQGKLDILGKPININASYGGDGDINLTGNVKINGVDVSTVNSISFNAFGKYWYFTKIGKIVFLNAPNDIKNVSVGFNVIGTLPAEYRPKHRIELPVANGSHATYAQFLSIGIDGIVQFYSTQAYSSANNNSFSTAYITN